MGVRARRNSNDFPNAARVREREKVGQPEMSSWGSGVTERSEYSLGQARKRNKKDLILHGTKERTSTPGWGPSKRETFTSGILCLGEEGGKEEKKSRKKGQRGSLSPRRRLCTLAPTPHLGNWP